MHVVDMFIFISIGQVVAWLVAMYMTGQTVRLIGNAFTTTFGAILGGYISLTFIDEWSRFNMIFAAFFGAVLALYLVRLRKWSFWHRSGSKTLDERKSGD